MKESKKPRWNDPIVSKTANWLVQDTTGEWHFLYAKPDETMETYNYCMVDGAVSRSRVTIKLRLDTLEQRA